MINLSCSKKRELKPGKHAEEETVTKPLLKLCRERQGSLKKTLKYVQKLIKCYIKGSLGKRVGKPNIRNLKGIELNRKHSLLIPFSIEDYCNLFDVSFLAVIFVYLLIHLMR